MEVTYLNHMGTDLSVVNAARVSFGKQTKEWRIGKDDRLLSFLARHKHELPFAHPHVSLHFKAPIFVARQLAKHQVGFVMSEISRRYVKDDLEFYWPSKWRRGSADIKQGSLDEEVKLGHLWQHDDKKAPTHAVSDAIWAYETMLAEGVCAEQARMVLPQNLMTEFRWTGSLLGWARVWGLRTGPGAQVETREVVEKLDEPLTKLFPAAWTVLKEFSVKKEAE